MDRFRTALQLHKEQQGQSGIRPQAEKAAGGEALPPPHRVYQDEVAGYSSLCASSAASHGYP
ncbi:MAG: hypothetical protein ABIR69_03640 [Nitrospiraceae bacterium]